MIGWKRSLSVLMLVKCRDRAPRLGTFVPSVQRFRLFEDLIGRIGVAGDQKRGQ
jgi:hypothetical protein